MMKFIALPIVLLSQFMLICNNNILGVTAFADSNSRVPWDTLRFIRQSSKFIALPNPLKQFQKQSEVKVQPGDILWSPKSSSSSGTKKLFTFSPLDDVVMGGASYSTFDENTGIWSGSVTSANNGGFVGIRSTPFPKAINMDDCTGIEIKVRGGNGKRFKGTTRDSTEFNGICWTTSFDTSANKNSIKTIRLPFKKLIPTIFARTVPDKIIQKDTIQAIQFAYSKFEYDGALNPNFELGDFSLQIIEIRAY